MSEDYKEKHKRMQALVGSLFTQPRDRSSEEAEPGPVEPEAPYDAAGTPTPEPEERPTPPEEPVYEHYVPDEELTEPEEPVAADLA